AHRGSMAGPCRVPIGCRRRRGPRDRPPQRTSVVTQVARDTAGLPRFAARRAYGFSVGTGLIVAFVVTVWADYFVLLALRRYDEAHNRSALEVLTPLSRVIRRAPARSTAEDFEYSE